MLNTLGFVAWFKVSKTHALSLPQGPSSQHQHTSRSQVLAHAELTSRAKFDTSAARDKRAGGRCSHRHHHARRATPIVTICAARPEAARQKTASDLKIHAAAWNLSTVRRVHHRSSSHSPAQAGRRTIALASGRRATLQFDRGLLAAWRARNRSAARRAHA